MFFLFLQDGDWSNVNNVNAGGGAGGSILIQADSLLGGGTIRARGGRGIDAPGNATIGGAGGGGRVALWYNYSEFPSTNATAPTGTSPIPGSAGTVFLRPHATDSAVLGTLSVDNGGAASSLYSPLATGLTQLAAVIVVDGGRIETIPIAIINLMIAANGVVVLRDPPAVDTLSISQGGVLRLDADYTHLGAQISLDGGTINGPGSLYLNAGTFFGSGVLSVPFVNSATVSPGTSPGRLVFLSGYTQTQEAALSIEVAGTTPETEFDVVNVLGQATINGALNILFTGGFAPRRGDKFQLMTASSRVGQFTTVTGLDQELAVAYIDTAITLISSTNLAQMSTTD